MVLGKHVRILGLPVPIPVRVSSCSGTISGLLYGQIPAAGNQSSHTHNASLSQNIHIRATLRRYILSEGNAPYECPAARESYPGYYTNKYPLREIKHPAYPPPQEINGSRKAYPGYLANLYLLVRYTRYPCGRPLARESYPGYFTNKYPLREINHPKHTMPLSLKTYISRLR
jgi:hypothetical protein